MTLLKTPFFRFSRKSTPAIATNMSLDAWSNQSCTHSTRLVQKVEMCTALCAGDDAWGTPLSKDHYHTLIRAFLVPTHNGPSVTEDIFLIERVLCIGGAHHSVTPIAETFPTVGTLFHPSVHDRTCVIADGHSTVLAHDLVVERTLTFSDHARITLAQFTQILALVSRTTKLICDGGDCKFQSRAFAFTCLAALAPTLPPRKAGEGVRTTTGCEAGIVDDSVFELSSEAFLGQVPWLVRDPASFQAECISLMGASFWMLAYIDRAFEGRTSG